MSKQAWPPQIRRPPGPAAQALVTPCGKCGGDLHLYVLGGKAHGAACIQCGRGIDEPMPTRREAGLAWLELQGVKPEQPKETT